jgi:hypothetical protein
MRVHHAILSISFMKHRMAARPATTLQRGNTDLAETPGTGNAVKAGISTVIPGRA